MLSVSDSGCKRGAQLLREARAKDVHESLCRRSGGWLADFLNEEAGVLGLTKKQAELAIEDLLDAGIIAIVEKGRKSFLRPLVPFHSEASEA